MVSNKSLEGLQASEIKFLDPLLKQLNAQLWTLTGTILIAFQAELQPDFGYVKKDNFAKVLEDIAYFLNN